MVWSTPSVSFKALVAEGHPSLTEPFRVTVYGKHAGYSFPQNQILAYARVDSIDAYGGYSSLTTLEPVLIHGSGQTFDPPKSTSWEAHASFDLSGAAPGEYQLVFGSTSDAPGAAFVVVPAGPAHKVIIP